MALDSTFKYITSDKVGDFCQRMHEAGLTVHVDDRIIWVHYGDGKLPEQVYIYTKASYAELVQEIIKKDKQ